MGAPVSSPSTAPPTRGRIPSPLHAFATWFTAAILLVVASLTMAAAAAASVAARGGDPVKLLGDPTRSPLLTEPTWIALGTLANELATLTAVGIWWLWLKPPRRVVLPFLRPRGTGLAGALLVVFGLAPLAEVAGELVHRVVQNDITASKVVVAAARSSSPAQFALILACLAVLPALAEEILFRGFITSAFERSFVAALIVPSLLFGIFHLEPTQAAGTVLLGVGFGLARLCTGSLVTSMLAHGIYNGAVLLAVRYADVVVDRQIEPVPVVFGLVLFAAGLALLLRERRARREGVELTEEIA